MTDRMTFGTFPTAFKLAAMPVSGRRSLSANRSRWRISDDPRRHLIGEVRSEPSYISDRQYRYSIHGYPVGSVTKCAAGESLDAVLI
jgi:hypothetical protein